MQVLVNTGTLRTALATISKIKGTQTLPVSTCLYVEADQNTGRIRMHASDGAFHALVSFPADTISYSGEALVDSSLFTGLAHSFFGSIDIAATANHGVSMSQKKNIVHVPGIDPTMRITEPITGAGDKWVIQHAGDLKEVINAIEYSRLKKSGNPTLTDIGLKIDSGEATFLTADGHRVALARIDCKGVPDRDIIVPAKAINDVLALSNPSFPITIEFFPNVIKFDAGDTTYYSPYAAGVFPPYQKHVTRRYTLVQANRAALMESLGRADLITARSDDMPGIVEIHIAGNDLFISGASTSGAIVSEQVDIANVSHPGATVKVYARFLLDAVKRCSTENIELDIDSAVRRPVLAFNEGNNRVGHLIMPMKPDAVPMAPVAQSAVTVEEADQDVPEEADSVEYATA